MMQRKHHLVYFHIYWQVYLWNILFIHDLIFFNKKAWLRYDHIKFTLLTSTIHWLLVYSQTFSISHNQHHYLIPEYFRHAEKKPHTHASDSH